MFKAIIKLVKVDKVCSCGESMDNSKDFKICLAKHAWINCSSCGSTGISFEGNYKVVEVTAEDYFYGNKGEYKHVS